MAKGQSGNSIASRRSAMVPAKFVSGKTKQCISCIPEDSFKPLDYFFSSTSPFHADGLVPMCKECVVKYSFDYKKNALNVNGFLEVLRQIDKPFIKAALDRAYADFEQIYSLDKVREETRRNNAFQVIPLYLKVLSSTSKYKLLRWSDGDISDSAASPIPLHDIDAPYCKPVTDDMRQRFGLGFTDDDYRMLDTEYEEWCASLGGEPTDKSKREIIKNCCYAKLATVHGVVDGGNISQLISSFNNSLSVGELKPQEKKAADATPLGVVIRDIQQHTPAEFYNQKMRHKDVQQYEEYIDRFLLRPMRNAMLDERQDDAEYHV